MVPVQTLDAKKDGQYKCSTYKRQTGSNLELVQTWDWDKRQTSKNMQPVQTSDGNIVKENVGLWLSLKKIPLL